jgi:hypothetical protein
LLGHLAQRDEAAVLGQCADIGLHISRSFNADYGRFLPRNDACINLASCSCRNLSRDRRTRMGNGTGHCCAIRAREAPTCF